MILRVCMVDTSTVAKLDQRIKLSSTRETVSLRVPKVKLLCKGSDVDIEVT